MRIRIEARLKELTGSIEVVSFAAGAPASRAALTRAEKAIGRPLPRALRSYFEACNGLALRIAHRTSALEGRLDLLPIEEMFGGRDGTRPWDDDAFRGALWLDDFADDLDAAVVKRFKKLRPLEWYEDLQPTCIELDARNAPMFMVDRWNIEPLACTVAEYFDAAVASLGLQGWREARSAVITSLAPAPSHRAAAAP